MHWTESNKMYHTIKKNDGTTKEVTLGQLIKIIDDSEEREGEDEGAFSYTDTDTLKYNLLKLFEVEIK